MANVGTHSLVTLDEARDFLKRTTTDDDDEIALYADLATAGIETYTARKIKSRTYSDGVAPNAPKMVLNGRGKAEIGFAEVPVTTLTSAVVRNADGSARTLNVSGHRLLHGGRRLWLPFDAFPVGEANIEVECVAGYLAGVHDSELRTLKLACLRWLQVIWQDKDLAVGRGANIAVGGESMSFIADAIPKDIALTLRPFERWF